MTYLEKINFLKNKVPNYTIESSKWLINKTKNNDINFKRKNITDINIGKFYFMKYDYNNINKSTKMEQNVPLLVVDYKPNIDNKVIYILNMNFLPQNIKEAFFSKLTYKYSEIFDYNENVENLEQEKKLPLNYKLLWDELIQFAFEYCIREIRIELINDLFEISTKHLHFLTSINTQYLTGVDEAKLNEIWITKLKNESYNNRLEELMTIKTNYYKILEELQEKFKNLNNRLKNI